MIDRILIDIHSGFYIVDTMPATMLIGHSYYTRLLAVGGTGVVTFDISAGSLPDGMTLVTAGPEAGSIQGTPTELFMVGDNGVDARARYTIKATDQAGNVAELQVVQEVAYAREPRILFDIGAIGADPVYVFRLIGGSEFDNSWALGNARFEPPLPNGWTTSNTTTTQVVVTPGAGVWGGEVVWDVYAGQGASRRVSLERRLPMSEY